jgi:hypothetical protein
MRISGRWLSLSLLLSSVAVVAGPKVARWPLHLADYDAELRQPDGHVDCPAMLRRLKELGVTDYYWLVWHARTDWDDLKRFLPQAQRAHINIWVYLVPPTEGPPNGYPPSEPFGLDYPRWAEEIAQLSLAHPNLPGFIIDDFFANHKLFTPDYVRGMQARAKAVNPRLKFLPLMYFPEITSQFVNDYRQVIDGVVVAYPSGREEVAQARAVLDGQSSVMPCQLSCPWNTPTQPGDFVSASIPVRVTVPALGHIRFFERDDFNGPTDGYHFKQVLLDDNVIWEQDVAGGTNAWHQVDLDVAPQALGKSGLTLTFRLFDKKAVSNFGVKWGLKDLQTTGLKPEADLRHPQAWQVQERGPWQAGFGRATKPERQQFHIPFVVMTAAVAKEFRLRHGNPASPERMADWLRMALQARRDGLCDGVVTYCLDKRPESREFPLDAKLFHQRKFRRPDRDYSPAL